MIQWYELRWYSERLPAGLIGEVLLQGATTSQAHFEIRDPEVWRTGTSWTKANFHSGLRVAGTQAARMIEGLTGEDRVAWCEFWSPGLVVHPSETAIYVGFDKRFELVASRTCTYREIDRSPYDDSPHVTATPYQVATSPSFLDQTGAWIAEQLGPIPTLAQWAGGIGGEQWFLLDTTAQLRNVVAQAGARSLFAVFGGDSVAEFSRAAPQEARTLADGAMIGNLRYLTSAGDDQTREYSASYVQDEADLVLKMTTLSKDSFIFNWPESGPQFTAVSADADGVIRARATFE